MCGITGIVNLNQEPVSTVVLRKMTDAISHRGPDADGIYTDGAMGLGHRRLIVLDLSPAGNQPMQTPDGRFVISYNGEIYNFRELRVELESSGHTFRSTTDSEVALHAWAEWGVKALDRFNGMFAFAVWDKKESTLWLVRDRYGIKPLYFTRFKDTILFASEIKAFLSHPGFKCAMDLEGLKEYLVFQNFLLDRTLFKDVRILPAGGLTRIKVDGKHSTVKTEKYWDFAFKEPKTMPALEAQAEELNHLFSQAVNRQLVSDRPIGTYLSGGIDSGSIAAIAARQIPNLYSFTVGFDLSSASGLEMGFDERSAAEYMSYLSKTEHYEMVLKAGDMERCMEELVWAIEEPRVGQSYPNFYASKLASAFCTSVLSGAGGDEMFGGYPWRYYRAVVNNDFDHYVQKYYGFWQRMLSEESLNRVLAPVASEVKHVDCLSIFKHVFAKHKDQVSSPQEYINLSLYFEAKTFLHGLLVVEDKLSMAHSLETRVPFLDNDLVDFAARVPVDYKLGNLGEVVRLNENIPGHKVNQFFEKTHDGKLILRRAFQSNMPDKITQAVKQGFSGPDASWFRGESIDYVRHRLVENRGPIYDYLDRDAVVGLVNDHLEGRENRRLLIWSLLCLDQWCRTFLGARA